MTKRCSALLTALFASLMLSQTPAQANGLDDIVARGTLKVAVPQDFPPFGSVGPDMKPRGLDIDTAKLLAEQLNKLGVVAWFAEGLKNAIVASGLDWLPVAAILVGVFVFSHYLFASTTAHISAMMLAFLTVGAQLIPADYVVPFMLMMTAGSAIMMTLTHYATGTSPIIFGSGYVTLGVWWRVGAVMCVLELLIFAVVGAAWWKLLGLW